MFSKKATSSETGTVISSRIANVKLSLSKLLDEATLLICHNAVYDLIWLWECGFKYDKPVFDKSRLGQELMIKGKGKKKDFSNLFGD